MVHILFKKNHGLLQKMVSLTNCRHDTCPYLVGIIWPDQADHADDDDDDDDGGDGGGDTIAIDYYDDEQYHKTMNT